MKLTSAVAAEEDHNVMVQSGNLTMEDVNLIGATANFADVRNLSVAQGRFVTQADDDHRSEIVFIGADLANKFFPNVDPIGKMFRVQTHTYKVWEFDPGDFQQFHGC